MPSSEYAKFSVALGFQSILAIFTDVGISNCIIALSGEKSHDPAVVGRYLAAARDLRGKMFWMTFIVSLIAFPLVVSKQASWSLTDKLLLVSSVLFSVYVQGWGMYQAPLIINGQMKLLYTPQTAIGAGRLGFTYLLHLTHLVSGVMVSWVNVIGLTMNTWIIYRSGSSFVTPPQQSDPEARKEVIRFIAPLVPGIILTAFQGQIALFMVTLFGSADSVADIAVLGRLSQLVLVITAFNGVILEPIIARTAAARLHRLVGLVTAVASLFGAALIGLTYFFPGALIWLISEKYAHLRGEFVLTVSVSVVAYLAHLLWIINSARKWLLWWATIHYLVVVIGGQVLCTILLDLSRVHDALILNLVINLCVLSTHLTCLVYNLIRTRRHR